MPMSLFLDNELFNFTTEDMYLYLYGNFNKGEYKWQ